MKLIDYLLFAAALFFAGFSAFSFPGCYAHTPPQPCANIENCGNPADYPPLWDAKKPDGGTDR